MLQKPVKKHVSCQIVDLAFQTNLRNCRIWLNLAILWLTRPVVSFVRILPNDMHWNPQAQLAGPILKIFFCLDTLFFDKLKLVFMCLSCYRSWISSYITLSKKLGIHLPCGSADYFDNNVNNRTHWKLTILFFMTTNCQIVCSCSSHKL